MEYCDQVAYVCGKDKKWHKSLVENTGTECNPDAVAAVCEAQQHTVCMQGQGELVTCFQNVETLPEVIDGRLHRVVTKPSIYDDYRACGVQDVGTEKKSFWAIDCESCPRGLTSVTSENACPAKKEVFSEYSCALPVKHSTTMACANDGHCHKHSAHVLEDVVNATNASNVTSVGEYVHGLNCETVSNLCAHKESFVQRILQSFDTLNALTKKFETKQELAESIAHAIGTDDWLRQQNVGKDLWNGSCNQGVCDNSSSMELTHTQASTKAFNDDEANQHCGRMVCSSFSSTRCPAEFCQRTFDRCEPKTGERFLQDF